MKERTSNYAESFVFHIIKKPFRMSAAMIFNLIFASCSNYVPNDFTLTYFHSYVASPIAVPSSALTNPHYSFQRFFSPFPPILMRETQNHQFTHFSSREKSKQEKTKEQKITLSNKHVKETQQKEIDEREKAPSGVSGTTRRRVLLVEIINVLWPCLLCFIALKRESKCEGKQSNWIRKLTMKKPHS